MFHFVLVGREFVVRLPDHGQQREQLLDLELVRLLGLLVDPSSPENVKDYAKLLRKTCPRHPPDFLGLPPKVGRKLQAMDGSPI